MVSKLRAMRIAERIHEELSILLLLEVADPRLASASITDVHVDRELAYANIYFSSIEGSELADQILDGFDHAYGFLRKELAQRIDLRVFPRLRFHWDPTPDNADHIDKLIASLHENENPVTIDTINPDESDHSSSR